MQKDAQNHSSQKIKNSSQKGSVFFYIFAAVALLGALTFSFVKDNRSNVSSQEAYRHAQDLYNQANLLRSAIMECSLTYPNGGGDLDSSGVIDDTDNPNNPYPVNPSFVHNPAGAAANDNARNLSCTGAPATERNIFTGSNNKGRFLPPPPVGFTEWTYINDADGVRVRTTAPASAAMVEGLTRVVNQFNDACQASLNYGACGARCLTVWVHHKTACP